MAEYNGALRGKQRGKKLLSLFKILEPYDSPLHKVFFFFLITDNLQLIQLHINNGIEQIKLIHIMQIESFAADVRPDCKIFHCNGIKADIQQHIVKRVLNSALGTTHAPICFLSHTLSLLHTYPISESYYTFLIMW